MKTKSSYLVITLALLTAVLFCSCKTVAPAHSQDTIKTLTKNAVLKKSWSELPIPMYISETVPEKFRPAIVDAMELWNLESGVVVFEYMGETDSEVQDFDELNVVYWNNDPHPDGFFGEAKTMFIYETEIIEGDVIFYGDPDLFDVLTCDEDDICVSDVKKKDITTTVLHELGHVLGFEHSDGDDEIMNPDFTQGDVHHGFDEMLLNELHEVYNQHTFADAS